MLEAAAKAVGALRDASAYRWVDLGRMFASLGKKRGGAAAGGGGGGGGGARDTVLAVAAAGGTPASVARR